jgi:hypothetical protein
MAFRRINVDQYDEEHSIPPNELVPENPLSDQDLTELVQAAAHQARSFLQRGYPNGPCRRPQCATLWILPCTRKGKGNWNRCDGVGLTL